MPQENPRAPEAPAQAPTLKQRLRTEALRQLREAAEDDSVAYERAALATGRFIARTLDAAELLEQQLEEDRALPANSPQKLSADVRRAYEAYVSQSEMLAMILPAQLQLARLVQYRTDVQTKLGEIADTVLRRDGLLNWIEETRSALLQAGTVRGQPIPMDRLPRLVAIADASWRLREQFAIPASNADLQALLAALRDRAEAGHAEATRRVETALRANQNVADVARRNLGADRIGQGLPGAELILDYPEQTMAVWRRLLLEGGANEKKRAAAQLRVGVQRFRTDFIDPRAALQTFEKAARAKMEEYKAANNGSALAQWFEFLGWEGARDRVINTPEAFDQVFEEVMKRMRAAFEEIGKMSEAADSATLITQLQRVEDGQEVDNRQLETLLNGYSAIQRRTGELIAALQRWQIGANVGVIDNPAFGRANMLEQVTRVGDQTLVGFLREHSPYGVLRHRSYYDQRTGRMVLVTPTPTPAQRGIVGNALEIAKIPLYAVPTALVFRSLVTRIPLLGRPLARVGIPILLAEASLAGAEAAARITVNSRALQATQASLETLRTNAGRMTVQQARAESAILFTNLVVLLHTARTDTEPGAPDAVLSMEAHLYTNQIMMALGYPPVHELNSATYPANAENIPEAASPELREFLLVRFGDIQRRRERTEQQRKELAALRQQIEEPQPAQQPQQPVAPQPAPAPANDPVSRVMRGEMPQMPLNATNKPTIRRNIMDAARSNDFRWQERIAAFSENPDERRAKVLEFAGKVFQTCMKLDLVGAYFRRQMGRIPRHDEIPMFEIASSGSISCSFADVIGQMREVQQGRSVADIAAVVRYLEENPPTNEELMQYWVGGQHTTGRYQELQDKMLANRFGAPGARTGMAESQFLAQWLEVIQQWNDMGMTPEKARKLSQGHALMREVNANNNGTYFTKQFGWWGNKFLYMQFDGTNWVADLGGRSNMRDPSSFTCNMWGGSDSYNTLLENLDKVNRGTWR